MSRILKVLGISLVALLLIAAAGVAAVYAWTGAEIEKRLPVPTHGFVAPTDAASIARGEHIVGALTGCVDCHGPDLGGMVVIDDPAIGTLHGPNLTRGRGGVVSGYADPDFERAVRHGIARDGRRLAMMPSSSYQHLSDEDLGALIAYLKTIPPVDREFGPQRIGLVARGLYVAGQFPLFEAHRVLHRDEVVATVPIDTTVAYGKYVGDIGCAGCHGGTYGGGMIPGAPPDWPQAANLTPTGIGHLSFEEFDHALRTGMRPDGSALRPPMPISATKLMTLVEMRAIYLYLASLPPRPFGTR